MAMITETEKLDAGPVMTCVQDSMETIEETMEASSGETVEELPGETMEETVEEENGSHKAMVRSLLRHVKPLSSLPVAPRKSHIKRMCEWLLPYLIVTILITGIGGVVLLASHSQTQRLNKQLQEKYGEYFADEQ